MSNPSLPERRSWAPWLVAAIAGVVFVAGIIVYYAPLSSARSDADAGALSGAERSALTAATTETANLLTYRRASFDADYARAINGSTGQLKKDIAAKKAVTKSTLTKGKFDLTARVTHQALVGSTGKKGHDYLVLISVNGYKSTTPDVPTQQNLEVTVTETGGKWLVSDVQNVAVS